MPIVYSVTFGYANDNFIIGPKLNTLTDLTLFRDFDDFVTASFYLIGYAHHQHNVYSGRAVMHILTDRKRMYRTDLLMLHWLMHERINHIQWWWGAGMYGFGNFGGEKIQNSYHQISGFDEVQLPYQSSIKMGITFTGCGLYRWTHRESFESALFSMASISSGILPNVFRNGLTMSLQSRRLKVEGIAGYGYRPDVVSEHASIFGSDWFFALRGTVIATQTWLIHGWYTKGIYGTANATHVGMGISWNRGFGEAGTIFDLLLP